MLEQISHIAHQHPEYAMAIAFAFAFIESLPFVGSFFPGMLTMPPIGWLMAKGIIPGTESFILIIIAAMLGDWVGFYLGYYCRHIAHQKAAHYHKSHWLQAGELFVQRYGAMSIIVGRFFGPFRSSIPLFAGIFNMRFTVFTIAAIPSVILWALVHLAPGMFVAWFNFDILAHGYLAMQYLLVMAIMAMSLTIIFSSKLQRWHQVDVCLSYISQRLQLPQSTRGTLLKLMLVSINLILLASAILHGSFDYINQSIYALVSSQHHLLIQLSLIHNAFCYIPFILLLTVAMALLLINQNQHRAAMHLCLSVSLAFVLCFALKYTIHYPRPSLVANFLGNQSLPSGHTCLTTAFVLSCFALPEHCKRMRLQLGIPFIVLTMATRVLIGAHWFSDVFMGWLLGYMAYLLTQLFINHYRANTISAMLQSYSVVVKHDVLMKSSQQRMLIAYAILSLAYAASTGKLIISPYLL